MTPSLPLPSPHLSWDTVTTANFIGIDGARGGWVVATWAHGEISLNLYRTLSEVPIHKPCRVLVDMPIGLPAHHRRLCDSEARNILGQRRSTIFPVPSRGGLCHFVRGMLRHQRASSRMQSVEASMEPLSKDTRARSLPALRSLSTHLHRGGAS